MSCDVSIKLTTESTKCQSQKFNSIGPKFQRSIFKDRKIFQRRQYFRVMRDWKATNFHEAVYSKIGLEAGGSGQFGINSLRSDEKTFKGIIWRQ